MEPLKIGLVGGELRIEGFPNSVKVIAMTGRKAQRIADLALHRSDLQFARDSLDALNNAALSDHIRESLWRSAIVHFFKCFDAGKGRFSLQPGSVYKGAPPEAMMNFEYFKLLRNKHLVHDENSYAQAIVGAILNNATNDRKVEKVFASAMFANTLDQAQYSNFQLSIQRALNWVERDFDERCTALGQDLEKIVYEDLLAMAPLTIRTPKLEELPHLRTRT